MGKVKRPEFINPARKIGRGDAIKKRCAFVCMRNTVLTALHQQGHGRGLQAAEGKSREYGRGREKID